MIGCCYIKVSESEHFASPDQKKLNALMDPPPPHAAPPPPGASSPAAPPPPPGPPPSSSAADNLPTLTKFSSSHPQSRPVQQPLKPKKKKKDFREILSLFHEDVSDAAKSNRVWTSLWQATLAEAQEEHKRRRQQEQHGLKRKKMGDQKEHPSTFMRGSLSRHGGLTQDHLKRARQGSTASTDSSDSIKAGRLGGRFPKNAPKGSKLLQKFGGRN